MFLFTFSQVGFSPSQKECCLVFIIIKWESKNYLRKNIVKILFFHQLRIKKKNICFSFIDFIENTKFVSFKAHTHNFKKFTIGNLGIFLKQKNLIKFENFTNIKVFWKRMSQILMSLSFSLFLLFITHPKQKIKSKN